MHGGKGNPMKQQTDGDKLTGPQATQTAEAATRFGYAADELRWRINQLQGMLDRFENDACRVFGPEHVALWKQRQAQCRDALAVLEREQERENSNV
jgi:hypothetical protein